MFGLTQKEEALLRKLKTPALIQDFLDKLPTNFEKKGDTHFSPRRVLQEKKAHCIEGAMLAAAALWLHGEAPLLLDMKTRLYDDEHVVALYRKNGYWGAISKTNHPVLRFRDPIYKTIRELALSYFHEYFREKDGVKTLVSYSRPFDLRRLGDSWVTAEDDLWMIDEQLNKSRHYPLVPKANLKAIRNATKSERKILTLRDWERDDRKT